MAGQKREARLCLMSRPSTSSLSYTLQDVDARHKAGHDGLGA
jgi:hypothetical protein